MTARQRGFLNHVETTHLQAHEIDGFLQHLLESVIARLASPKATPTATIEFSQLQQAGSTICGVTMGRMGMAGRRAIVVVHPMQHGPTGELFRSLMAMGIVLNCDECKRFFMIELHVFHGCRDPLHPSRQKQYFQSDPVAIKFLPGQKVVVNSATVMMEIKSFNKRRCPSPRSCSAQGFCEVSVVALPQCLFLRLPDISLLQKHGQCWAADISPQLLLTQDVIAQDGVHDMLYHLSGASHGMLR